MLTVLRIKDWDKHFENNRTRELKKLAWVPMPIKMDGDGYTELVDHPQGAAHFGVWCALVEVAAKCEPRGTLLRDGQKPHNSDSLARITRLQAKTISDAITRLIHIGWLESQIIQEQDVTSIPQEGAGIPHEDATSPHLPALKGKERKGKEKKGKERKDSGFAAFWLSWPKHPRKVDRAKCQKWWETNQPPADEVMRGLAAWKQSEMWAAEGGRFIPLPYTWLRNRRWEDEAVPAVEADDDNGFVANPPTPEELDAIMLGDDA